MKLALVLSLFLFSFSPSFGENAEFYVGTYTKGDSKGIYRLVLNLKSGELSAPQLAAEIENPSFLAVSPDRNRLYAVVEVGKFKGEAGGGLVAFNIADDGTLRELSAQNTGGGAPCHLSVSPDGKTVVVANYSGGNVASFPVLSGGATGPITSLIQHVGSSVNKNRQEAPHAHAIYFFGNGEYAAAADLGTDLVVIYTVESGKLKQAAQVKLLPGSGPRHLAFHPTEKYAYVINEMLLTTAAFELKSPTEWTGFQYLSTLPEGTQPVGSTAEIQMHPSGNFVYGSNRGHNTIVVYAIDQKTGTLKWVENEPIQGEVPRGFNLTPDGRFLIAAGQNSNTVAIFSINQETGSLDFTGHKIEVPSPVSIVFR